MTTLKEVADVAQVSVTTVSRLLSGDPALSVPEDTRERVLRAAQQLHYQAKPKRREIGRRKIRNIGMIPFGNEQSERDDPYFLAIRKGMEQECRKLGLGQSVVMQWSEMVNSYSDFLNLDGLIVVGFNREAADFFQRSEQRVVFVDRCPDVNRFDSVTIDFVKATHRALEHIASLGHESIGYIGASQEESSGQDPRLEAYKEFLAFSGLYRPEHVHVAPTWSVGGGYEMAKAILDSGQMAAAYFIASDPLAIGAIRAWTEAGVRVPDDVAVVGFDDIELAAFMTPPLTTVHIPTEMMGRMAVHLLVDGVGDLPLPVQLTVPTELKIRESCGFSKR